MNYWKQLPHVLKYFREKENPTAKLPQTFMQGFLEVCSLCPHACIFRAAKTARVGPQLKPTARIHVLHSIRRDSLAFTLRIITLLSSLHILLGAR